MDVTAAERKSKTAINDDGTHRKYSYKSIIESESSHTTNPLSHSVVVSVYSAVCGRWVDCQKGPNCFY